MGKIGHGDTVAFILSLIRISPQMDPLSPEIMLCHMSLPKIMLKLRANVGFGNSSIIHNRIFIRLLAAFPIIRSFLESFRRRLPLQFHCMKVVLSVTPESSIARESIIKLILSSKFQLN